MNKQNLEGKIITFLGDSITACGGASSFDKGYVNVFQKMSKTICFNHGISGTRIAKQSSKSYDCQFDKDFISRVDELEDNADYVIIFGGTNDFGHGDSLFTDGKDLNAYTFCGALKILYTKIKEKYTSDKVIVITPLHRIDENSDTNEWGFPTKAILKQYVKTIIKVANKFSFKVLDLYNLDNFFPVIKGKEDKLFFDGIHPNDLGHEIIASKLFDFIIENK